MIDNQPGSAGSLLYVSYILSSALLYHVSAPVGHFSTCTFMVSESAPVMVTQGLVFKLNTPGNCVTHLLECLQSSGFHTTVISSLVYFNFFLYIFFMKYVASDLDIAFEYF